MRAAVLRVAACAMALLMVPTQGIAQATAAGDVLSPARTGLEAVPFPALDALEPAVAAQLADARAAFAAVAAESGASRSDLGAAYGALGRVFHAYEFFASAEPAYRNAARLQTSEPGWPHLLGYLFQQTGRFDEAADRYAAAVRLRETDRAAALRLADVWLELNRLVEAREQYTSLVPVFPAAAARGLGEVSLRERRYREAVEHFSRALERAPHASALHYSLAMAYRGLGRIEDARAQLEQRGPGTTVAADPFVDALPLLIRGERLLVIQGSRAYAAGRFDEAARAFERALQASPASVPARVNLASTLVQLGDLRRAAEELRGALAQGPVEEQTVVSLAILLAERQQYGDAIDLLEAAWQRAPAGAATITTLARLLASSPDLVRRDGARALDLATAVYQREPGAAHAETVALALAELGRCVDALEWTRRAIAAAETAQDSVEATRLRGELPRFQASSCRAPGR